MSRIWTDYIFVHFLRVLWQFQSVFMLPTFAQYKSPRPLCIFLCFYILIQILFKKKKLMHLPKCESAVGALEGVFVSAASLDAPFNPTSLTRCFWWDKELQHTCTVPTLRDHVHAMHWVIRASRYPIHYIYSSFILTTDHNARLCI